MVIAVMTGVCFVSSPRLKQQGLQLGESRLATRQSWEVIELHCVNYVSHCKRLCTQQLLGETLGCLASWVTAPTMSQLRPLENSSECFSAHPPHPSCLEALGQEAVRRGG